jgi:RNA polymerase sigma-70 factor (ECF subfamily)
LDEELRECVWRLDGGEAAALGEIYDLVSCRVYNYAAAIMQNKQAAEDVTHDVFLQIMGRAEKVAKSPNPLGFILLMTRNHAYNVIKREKRSFATGGISEVAEAAKITNCSGTIDDRLMLEEAFKKLPPNQREVIYLHLICGFKQQEIAKMQSAPLVTIKWRYSKALASLRMYLKKEDICYESI